MNNEKKYIKRGLKVCGIGVLLSAIFSYFAFDHINPDIGYMGLISTGLHGLGFFLNYKELRRQSDLENKIK